jgi:hypothetical protein
MMLFDTKGQKVDSTDRQSQDRPIN